jgi:hypothetical protein
MTMDILSHTTIAASAVDLCAALQWPQVNQLDQAFQ